MKKMNKKGFTLAELLIVVAIIGVLVAIAIPVFTTQLEKSREATDMANVRSAYANIVANYLTNADNSYSMTVAAQQTQTGWANTDNGKLKIQVDGSEKNISFNPVLKPNSYKVAINKSGSVTVTQAS